MSFRVFPNLRAKKILHAVVLGMFFTHTLVGGLLLPRRFHLHGISSEKLLASVMPYPSYTCRFTKSLRQSKTRYVLCGTSVQE